MRKRTELKIRFVQIQPKTPEEAVDQQRRIDMVYDRIFDEVAKKIRIKNSSQLR